MEVILFTNAVIIGLLLAETAVSRRHDRQLRARGAFAPPGDPYRALALLYPTAFLVMAGEGLWRAAQATPAPGGPSWFLSGVLLFAAGKAIKYWAIAALGERWSFRVFVVPGAPLVTTGPYRYTTHPNYIGVVAELAGAAMMDGARLTGPLMMAAFGLALAARIRFENTVLRDVARRADST